MKLVSLVVPCYNVEKYIEQCLTSIRDQTYKNIEVILVDDGSPDNSGAICDRFALDDERFKVIHKENAGVGAARNDGMAMASGDYIIFIDSDDYLPLNALELLVSKAEETDADVVMGDLYKVFDEREEYCTLFQDDFFSDDKDFLEKLTCNVLYRNYCPYPPEGGPVPVAYGSPWNKLVKSSLLGENNITFDTSVKGLFDDVIYSACVLTSAKNVAYIKQPIYCYRVSIASITQGFKRNMPEISDAIVSSMGSFVEKNEQYKSLRKAYYAFCIRVLAYSLPRYYCSTKSGLSILNRAQQLKAVMKKEPYRSAVENVDMNILTSGQRKFALLMKNKAALLTIILFNIRKNVK